ncbi:MAG: acyloxyacyl hydrolase [Myxococcales bacterium]|nr:acyloxyacyl hydrolase [Myxococcales bacterium]
MALVVTTAPTAGHATSEEREASLHRAPFGRGQTHWGLGGGYAFSIHRNGPTSRNSTYGATGASLAIGITDPMGGGAWYGGNIDLMLEGAYLFASQPSTGRGGGGSVLLRWNWLGGGRFVPFANVGAGIVDLNFNLPSQRDGFNFLLQGGLGAHVFVTERRALTAEWRYQHISNANLRLPNKGVDTSAFLVGATFFY